MACDAHLLKRGASWLFRMERCGYSPSWHMLFCHFQQRVSNSACENDPYSGRPSWNIEPILLGSCYFVLLSVVRRLRWVAFVVPRWWGSPWTWSSQFRWTQGRTPHPCVLMPTYFM